MASHKFLFVVALVLVVLVINSEGFWKRQPRHKRDKANHFILGSRITGDRRILQRTVYKPSKPGRIIVYQQSFNSTKGIKLTQVVVLDKKSKGNGASVSLVRDGPGHQNVTLKFTSKKGHGIHCTVTLYGRKAKK